MTEQTAKISIRNLNHNFRAGNQLIPVLQQISFEVKPKEFFCILGPSGCGKSTLLNILSGLLQPTSGEIIIDGKPLDVDIRKNIGYVFQDPRLLPWRNVLHNVAFGLENKNLPKSEVVNRANEQIQLVGLSEFKYSYPNQLSGGMRQRVALARVLATDPDIILMDEPFGSLDFHTRNLLQKELLSLWMKKKRTIIFVTHDPYEAVFLADRILILGNRPAVVKSCQTINLPRPRRWQDPKTFAIYFETLDSIGYAE